MQQRQQQPAIPTTGTKLHGHGNCHIRRAAALDGSLGNCELNELDIAKYESRDEL